MNALSNKEVIKVDSESDFNKKISVYTIRTKDQTQLSLQSSDYVEY